MLILAIYLIVSGVMSPVINDPFPQSTLIVYIFRGLLWPLWVMGWVMAQFTTD